MVIFWVPIFTILLIIGILVGFGVIMIPLTVVPGILLSIIKNEKRRRYILYIFGVLYMVLSFVHNSELSSIPFTIGLCLIACGCYGRGDINCYSRK